MAKNVIHPLENLVLCLISLEPPPPPKKMPWIHPNWRFHERINIIKQICPDTTKRIQNEKQ